MTQSVSLNAAVREYQHPCARYQRVFNRKAEELGVDVRWTRDSHHFNSLEPDEVTVGGQALTSFDAQSVKDIGRVLNAVEAERKKLVHESATLHRHIPFRAPVEQLRPVEQAAVRILHDEVKPLIDRIEALQNTHEAADQVAWVARFGDEDARKLVSRFHRDQLAGPLFYDERGSLLQCFPDLPPVNGMISPDISLDEFKDMAKSLPPEAEELRPSTMVYRENGTIRTRPIARDPLFQKEHQTLAALMDKLARLKVGGEKLDPKTRAQLSAWGQYFRTGSLQDEAKAVQASIDAGESESLLRIHIGPSESYWADNIKFPYDLQVGVRDAKIQQDLQGWQPTCLKLEQSLADVPNYQPRPVKMRGGFADPIYQAVTGGFIETFYAREVKGVNFPNYPYPGVEGSNRFMLLEAMAPVAAHAREVAEKLLDKVPDKLEETETMYAPFHESGHLLGPPRSHITPSGLPMGLVFGDKWGWAEEPKADLTVSEMLSSRARAGEITQEQKRTHLEAATNILLSFYPGKKLFEDGKATDHYYGFLLQTGYYLQTGALTKVGDRLHIDPDKIETASHDLWKKLISFQAAGQVDAFLAFGNQVIQAIPPEVDQMILKAQGDYRPYFVDHQL